MWLRARNLLEDWLFAPRRGREPLARLRRLAQFAYALVRDLLGGQLNLHAMGLVYATLLALIPLLAFSFAILRLVGAHHALEPLVLEFFRPMGDGAAELTHKVMDFADRVRGGVVGSVGLGLLIWTLLGALKKVEDSLNFVWHVEVPRSFMRRVSEYLALLVLAPLLLGALVGMSRLPELSASGRLLGAALAPLPYVLISGIFAAIYALIPNTRVRPAAALIGGVGAGVLWAAVGKVFTAFVLYSASLTVVYAGFAIFVAALIWTYVSWVILLLGAQLSFYVQNPSYLRAGLREPRLSGAESERLALSLMYLVARTHLRGEPLWSINALADFLHLPSVLISRLADRLEGAGLLITTEHDTLLPGRDAGHIRVADILVVARESGGVGAGYSPHRLPAVVHVCAGFEDAWRASVAERDLESLVLSAAAVDAD